MPEEPINDAMELQAIAQRNEAAFASWMGRSEESMRLSLRSFARSVDVEAVVQDALMRAWQVAPMLEPDGKPNVLLRWAVTVARNRARDIVRRSGRELPLDDLDDMPALPAVAPSDPLLADRIKICFERLQGKPAVAFTTRLQASGRVSDRQLAEIASMTFDSFRQNLSRARKALEHCLERYGIRVRAMLS